jgi:hypothetical protein
MNIITIDPSISNKDTVVTAFSNYEWKALNTTNEVSSTRTTNKGWTFNLSIRKGKRSFRCYFYKGGKHISIYSSTVRCDLVGISIDKVTDLITIDLDIFDNYYKVLDEKHLKMVEGRRELKFKNQLCIPYVEGRLEELGAKILSTNKMGPKSFQIRFNSTIDTRRINALSLKAVKYADFLEKDFEDLIFDMDFECLCLHSCTLGKALKIIKMYSESEQEIETQLVPDREEHAKLLKQIQEIKKTIAPLEMKLSQIESKLGNKAGLIKASIDRKIKNEGLDKEN